MNNIFYKKPEHFNCLRISIASPEIIRKWSKGEVKKADTVNYRTIKPESDGLFCAKIFGPVQDYECLCGKYKRIKYKGTVCEKCEVEITSSKVRRERMGHIELASPIVHIWFLKSLPSRISTILNINLKKLEKILNYDLYIVSNPGISSFIKNELISESKYNESIVKLGEYAFNAGTGPEIIREILKGINLKFTKTKLKKELLKIKSYLGKKKIIKRLKLIDNFILSKNKLEWMILKNIPIIPPELRPLVMLEGGRFATSDLNELYRRIINRNNRLKKLIELKAPEIIIKNEKRMLQESVDALFDNNKKNKIVKSSNKRPLKSLSDMLKGKHGRFRQNLLGKRVDYSGRSVIIVGANLKLKQCGLPKKMALELMKPFIYSKLELYKISETIKEAKKIVDEEKEEVWDILEEVIKGHPIILNRAPTLHRLSIQAFDPVLIEGKAIQLHPLVCAAFNADFDGDQMAVHIPLSIEAQLEARILMMSCNNILNPANGDPIIVPTQDIVLGVYYLSLSKNIKKQIFFNKIFEIEHAIINKKISIHSMINFKINNEIIKTTPGRIFIANLLPLSPIIIKYTNKIMTKDEVSKFINIIYRTFGQNKTVDFVDNLMKLGFYYASKAGITIGKDDIITPKSKNLHINNSIKQIKEYEIQYSEGLITSHEKYNKSINEWILCTEKISNDMIKILKKNNNKSFDKINNMYIMSNSGARGSYTQIRQLAGIRGLMTKPSGEIIENPIISNFKEGLNEIEYFISTHGARKGLADTALKTANSGYLTRKLVDVSQDCIIKEKDCNTKKYITAKQKIENGEIFTSLRDIILGRIIQRNIIVGIKEKKLIKKGTLIDEELMYLIENSSIENIKVRSPIFCNSDQGICQKCYGRDLSTGKIISLGEAVGIIAAQSIGEPGTQLTMRTFHIGGAAQKIETKSDIISPHHGIIKFKNISTIINKKKEKINMTKNGEIIISRDKIIKNKIPYGAKIFINNKDFIKSEKKIAEWDPFTIPIISKENGYIVYEDIKENISIKKVQDKITGIINNIIINNNNKLRPKIYIYKKNKKITKKGRYFLPINAVLYVKNKQEIAKGEILAKVPKQSSKNKDITGGLPRVIELFEAREPKEKAIISESNGYVEYKNEYKTKRKIIVKEKNKILEYFIPRNSQILVNEGDYIKKGDIIVNGNISPRDTLRILGKESFVEFMTYEIQKVYKLQGVKINNKHIEVILKQMIRKVEITDPGDTVFVKGEQVNLKNLKRINKLIIKNKHIPARSKDILLGITKASLQTNSFLSAASFQETVKILTEASIASKTDHLEGLKENVISGKLIPAGTGFYTNI